MARRRKVAAELAMARAELAAVMVRIRAAERLAGCLLEKRAARLANAQVLRSWRRSRRVT